MPQVRQWSAASVVKGTTYVFGGDEIGGGPATSVVLEYDPDTDTWATLADMPFEGLGMSASVVDGMVYVIGGCAKGYPCREPHLSTVWEYVPQP